MPHNQNNWPHTYQQNMIRAEIQKKHYFQEHQRQVEMFGMQEPSMEQAHARNRYAATNAQDPTDYSDLTSIQFNMMQTSTPRLGYNSLPPFSTTRAFPNSEVWYRLGQRTSIEASLQNTSTLTNCLITSQKIADQTTPSSLDESSRFSPASSSSIAALMSPTAPASVHESRARHVSTVSTSPKTFTLLSASSGDDVPKHKKTREQTSPTLPKSSSSTLSDITSIDSFVPISQGSPLSDPLLDSRSPEHLVEIVRSRKRKKEEKTQCCLVAPITNNTRKHGTPYRPRLDKASRANLLKFIKPDDVHLRRKDFVVKVWERQKRAGVDQSPEYQIGNIFITKRRELLRSTDDHE